MECEACNKTHDGSYGSGRFCAAKCARGYSTKSKRKEINEKVSKALIGNTNGGKFKKEIITVRCLHCPNEFDKSLYSSKQWCTYGCWVSYKKTKKTPRQLYKDSCKFKFNVYDFPNYFKLSLINEYGWYSPSNKNNNLNGISRDHKISITEGFNNGYDPVLLAHPANCMLVRHRDNQKKNTKSSITYEQLLSDIKQWQVG